MKGGPGAHAWPTRDRPRADAAGECRVTTARPERRHAVRRRTPKDASTATATKLTSARAGRPDRAVAPRPPATPPRTYCRAGGISSAQRSWLVRVPFFMSPTHQSYQLLAPTNSWRANAWDGASALSGCIPISLYLSISKHAAR